MKCIAIVGNLGANAVRRTTSDGRELMTFSVAVNDGKKQRYMVQLRKQLPRTAVRLAAKRSMRSGNG